MFSDQVTTWPASHTQKENNEAGKIGAILAREEDTRFLCDLRALL